MVAIVPSANAYTVGIAKQASGTAVAGTAAYSAPVYAADLTPTYELSTMEITDASSIQGDPVRGVTSWAGSVEIPMFEQIMGTAIQGMWNTDTVGTATVKVHTFTGLGGTQPFITMFDNFTNTGGTTSGAMNVYGNGLISELEFTASADDPVGRMRVAAVGATPSNAAWTATTAEAGSNGYFSLQQSGASVKADVDTPDSSPSVALTNVTDLSIKVSRPVTPVATVDALSMGYLSQGKTAVEGSMTFTWATWAEYLASYYGSVTGTAVSSTIVKGALLVTFVHSVSATHTFTLYIPSVQFFVPRPSPDPGGGVLTQAVTLRVFKPSSGEHLQPVLGNAVATAYSA